MPGRWLDGDDVGGSPRERARVAADRASKACNECKSRHDKCDGVKPVCSRCTGRGLMCSYVRPTKIAGPRRGWVDDFKARIEAAERSVHRLSTLIAKSKSGIFSPRHEFSDQATLLRTHGSPRDCIDAALRNIEQMVTDMCNDLEGAAGITDSASPTTSRSTPLRNKAYLTIISLPHWMMRPSPSHLHAALSLFRKQDTQSRTNSQSLTIFQSLHRQTT
ncbi:hypothetical protein M427DRAFT_250300 [Gonapodya prolifera JEL478]|uniref:Zn(2)-C6 fungal-type domain-containing protein n=1 Tax=Gonapodya prolifera (strain JEL478) TaxID=1344416 RepID=A0A138ZXI6_GONPJ|nr:hypothetical protein M427DRAFT_250300 [Gonapodya prolifera JEL478]|eukprot:KXS09161.1 hypothetical protein M427DRAFT_250300 [Gonapodya prolifera JEL478]